MPEEKGEGKELFSLGLCEADDEISMLLTLYILNGEMDCAV